MRNFQDAFETRKQLFVSAFSICMTVPLSFHRGFSPAPLQEAYRSQLQGSFTTPSQSHSIGEISRKFSKLGRSVIVSKPFERAISIAPLFSF